VGLLVGMEPVIANRSCIEAARTIESFMSLTVGKEQAECSSVCGKEKSESRWVEKRFGVEVYYILHGWEGPPHRSAADTS
jgi:hypothetical protein